MSLKAAPFLAPPLKRADKVELKTPFRNFIYSTYQTDADNFNQAISDLQTARDVCCTGTMDKHESSVDTLSRFYDQLVAIEAKLPVGEGQIPVKYTWYDCMVKKEGFFSSSSRKAALNSGAFERLCVLFNVASMNAIVASEQNLETDVGLKLACKAFPLSAALFQHLRDQVFSQLTTVPTPDMSGDTAIALSSLMLAQGQECFFHKAAGAMKSTVVAKVAAQTADYYGDAMRALDNSAVRAQWDKTWIPIVSGKQSYFLGLADYYDSLSQKESKKFGEQISRLRHAGHMLQQAARQGENNLNVKVALDRVNRDLVQAQKENDMIYNAIIPDYGAMPAVGRAAVAKIPPMPAHPMSGDGFRDSFEALVPLEVHQASAAFESKRQAHAHQLCMRSRDATQAMNSELAGMNLPAALEDTTGTEVPPSVMEKSQGIQGAGGWQPLQEKIENLPDSLQRNMDIVQEMSRVLDEEEQEDDRLRARFAAKWNRTESKKLTGNFRKEIAKYNAFLTSAQSADAQVRAKFESHLAAMQMLCSSPEDLNSLLPSGGPSAQSGSESVLQLQNFMARWNQLRSDREQLEAAIEQTTFDIKSRFLTTLRSDGAVNEEAMSPQILEELFGDKQGHMEANVQEQEQLLFQIKAANEQFVREKSFSSAASEREEMLKRLASAYDVFTELNANLTEGTKFYGDLTTLLLQLSQKVNDLIFARNTEKEDALKDLQSSIAGSEHAPAPAQPAYQQAPPTRPPPPKSTVAAGHRPAPTPPTTSAAPATTVASGFPKPAPRQNPPRADASAAPTAPPAAAPAYSSGYAAPGYGAPPNQQAPGYAPPAYGGYPTYPSYPPAGAYYPPPGAPYGGAPQYGGYPGQGAPPSGQPGYPVQGAPPVQPGYPQQGYPGQAPPPGNPNYPGYAPR